MNNTAQPKKIIVQDASISDNKIPRNLILMYDKTPFILKAGLEWKANKIFGIGKFSLITEPITVDFEKQIFVFKATFKVLKSPHAEFVNFGEARPSNANSMMQKQLFHLAITRAECRVLRMATACGYASYEEVKTMNGDKKEVNQLSDGDQPATEEQVATLKSLLREGEDPWRDQKFVTKQQAADKIAELLERKK